MAESKSLFAPNMRNGTFLTEDFIRSKIIIKNNRAEVDDALLLILREALHTASKRLMICKRSPELGIGYAIIDFFNIPKSLRKHWVNVTFMNRARELINETETKIKNQVCEDPEELLQFIQYTSQQFRDELEKLYFEYEKMYRKGL